MISRNDPCFCGSGKKWKKCCYPKQPLVTQASLAKTYLKKYNVHLKTSEQIKKIRRACQLAATILKKTVEKVAVGTTTNELNKYAHDLHLKAGAVPAPLGYGHPPFPKSICTSINDVICHGIPNDQPLQDGDILNIDVTCILDGYYGDCSAMATVGNVKPEAKQLIEVTKECLDDSIAITKPGLPLNSIADAIEEKARKYNYTVVYQFVAHGVGIHFHEEPQVCHHHNNNTMPLAEGMIFTIEPMINQGAPDALLDDDEWTARTVDQGLSAQWEHTILITESGHEILTISDDSFFSKDSVL